MTYPTTEYKVLTAEQMATLATSFTLAPLARADLDRGAVNHLPLGADALSWIAALRTRDVGAIVVRLSTQGAGGGLFAWDSGQGNMPFGREPDGRFLGRQPTLSQAVPSLPASKAPLLR